MYLKTELVELCRRREVSIVELSKRFGKKKSWIPDQEAVSSLQFIPFYRHPRENGDPEFFIFSSVRR